METIKRPRVVAGFARSGTTWVQDVLAESNGLRPVFEPLHPLHIPGADKYAHRCLAADDEDTGLRELLQPFFTDDFRSLWADYRIIRRKILPRITDFASLEGTRHYLRNLAGASDKFRRFHPQRRNRERIVKFVRANMLLSWLTANFAARIVFVIRHPAAVVLSQMSARAAWNPMARIARYRRDQRLLGQLDVNVRKLLFETTGDIEAHTLSWCIENRIALDQANASGIHTVFYEKLLSDAANEWAAILDALALSKMPDQRLIRRPSQQAWGDKASNASLIRAYGGWMDRVDRSSASRIQRVLDATGMGMYSVNSADPYINF